MLAGSCATTATFDSDTGKISTSTSTGARARRSGPLGHFQWATSSCWCLCLLLFECAKNLSRDACTFSAVWFAVRLPVVCGQVSVDHGACKYSLGAVDPFPFRFPLSFPPPPYRHLSTCSACTVRLSLPANAAQQAAQWSARLSYGRAGPGCARHATWSRSACHKHNALRPQPRGS